MDIGGIGFGPDATDVFMEGLYIPMLKLIDQGVVNETLMAMIRANTRLPIDTEGDTYSLAGCNDVGAKRLIEMMDEFGIDTLDTLADHICARSREAVMAEIAKLPRGTWHNEMTVDGYDEPVTLRASLTVSESGIHVDYTGTSAQSRFGINVPMAYTTAYTVFGLGCVVASAIPNNAGSLGPLTVSAPKGAILNAPKPAPVCIRHVIGQMLPDVVFGCLRQIIPDRVPAEGTSCLWNLNVRGETQSGSGGNYGFMMAVTSNGGTGARPDKDGLSATAYPSGVRGTPVEIAESQTPLIFWKKELRPDSGGAGRTRGGLGQVIEIESGVGRPWDILAAFDRIEHPRARPRRRRQWCAGLHRAQIGQEDARQGFPARAAGRPAGGAHPGRRRHRCARQARGRTRRARPRRRTCLGRNGTGCVWLHAGEGRRVKKPRGESIMFTRREFMVGSGAVLTSTALTYPASAATNLDLATVWPDGNFHTTNAKRFAAEVAKVTKGEVTINVQSGGSLGFKGPEQLRAVRDGLVPMADILNIQQIGDEPMLGTESIPFLVGSDQELKILHKYLRPEYEAIAAKNRQKVLYMVPWPTQYLHLKVKTDTLDGLKGVKIRVPDKNAQDMCAAVGMAPVLIPWGETIPALASGAVSGVSTSSVSGVDGKFWEFLKYVYPTNHTWSCQMVNINNDTWAKLGSANQKAIEELAKKLEPDFWAESLKADKDSLKRLTDGGMEVVQIPPAMMKDFQARTAPLLDAFLKRVPAAEKSVKAFLAEVKRA